MSRPSSSSSPLIASAPATVRRRAALTGKDAAVGQFVANATGDGDTASAAVAAPPGQPPPAPLPGPGGNTPYASTEDGRAVAALAPLFRLLGDPSRLSIVFVCLHEAICVSEIARATGLSSSLVSHHLRLLRGARVVRGVRRGKRMFYTAADDHVRRMIVDMREHVVECAQDERSVGGA